MNIVEMFPKAPSKAALKRSGIWQEMLDDIEGCTSSLQLTRCQFVWSLIAAKGMWPEDWIEAASEEFDKAVESVARAQGE